MIWARANMVQEVRGIENRKEKGVICDGLRSPRRR